MSDPLTPAERQKKFRDKNKDKRPEFRFRVSTELKDSFSTTAKNLGISKEELLIHAYVHYCKGVIKGDISTSLTYE